MPTLTLETEPRAVAVRLSDTMLEVTLDDGRELAAPIGWFARLRDASPEQRGDWRLIGHGEGIHWPQVDEDISVLQLLKGRSRRNRAA